MKRNRFFPLLLTLAGSGGMLHGQPAGIFEGHADVGMVLHPGSVEYDASRRVYRIAASGDNMWAASDAFHFVWKKVSGDVTLTADISILGTGGEAHRKAVLMIRQSLDADSAYADAALHGDGLTSIQSRAEKGGNTTEVQANISAPRRLRIAKRGDNLFLWVAPEGEKLRFSGGAMRLLLTEPFYVGLGVCAHNKDNIERAEFSNVELTPSTPDPAAKPVLYSAVELAPVPGDRRVAYVAAERIEAPAWAPDGASIYFASDRTGVMQIWRMKPDGTQQEQVTSDAFGNWAPRISPDGRRIAVLSMDKTADQDVLLRVLTLSDKRVQSVVRLRGGGQGALDGPAWSPDSRRLAFVSHHLVTE
jgi:hypothetical protein